MSPQKLYSYPPCYGEVVTNARHCFVSNKSLETKAVEIPETKEFKPINNSLNFEKISHLEEEKVSPTYFNLTAVHNSEEKKLDYSEMSDSEFAESLAAEILEKCKIKEQLCRQKIAQEVLSKLC